MKTTRSVLALALLAASAGALAQSTAVRVDSPDWGQVRAIEAVGSQGVAWKEYCHAAGVQDNMAARYVDGEGRTLGSREARDAWLGSIKAGELAGGELGPVVVVFDNTPPARPEQVLLRVDTDGPLERDLACLARRVPVGEVVGYDIIVESGGRLFKWRQGAGSAVVPVGAWVRPPYGAIMSGYAPGHAPPAPPRGDWADEYYIGYPYAERYGAPVVD